MFNKESEVVGLQKAETVIGPSIKVKGDFHGEGDIIIEGSVEGEISTKQFISVGANAKIVANITANNAKIAGTINGDLRVAGYLEILHTAVIDGDVHASEISIEKGAILHGKLNMKNDIQITDESK
jgi:cytoskeletal protein CcmA (bactofilin family)